MANKPLTVATVNATSAVSVWAPTLWATSGLFGQFHTETVYPSSSTYPAFDTYPGQAGKAVTATVNATSGLSGNLHGQQPLMVAQIAATSALSGRVIRLGELFGNITALSGVSGTVGALLAVPPPPPPPPAAGLVLVPLSQGALYPGVY